MATSKNVTVVCKLPHGLVISVGGKEVTLKGQNSDPATRSPLSVVLHSEAYGTTQVNEDFMEAWMKRNAKHPAVLNGAIKVVSDKASAKSASRDSGKTGFEAMKKEAQGVKTDDGK